MIERNEATARSDGARAYAFTKDINVSTPRIDWLRIVKTEERIGKTVHSWCCPTNMRI